MGRQIAGFGSLSAMIDETEIELRSGDWSATVSTYGASLRGVTWRGLPVVTGYRGAEAKQGGQGDVLIPFPGRVRDGRYAWDGASYELPLTDKDGPNAIHGFVRRLSWTADIVSDHAATFGLEFDGAKGYPFPLRLALRYELSPAGLAVELTITNTGVVDAPVGAGFHPYFTVGSAQVDGDTLELPFSEVLEFERLLPTGHRSGVEGGALDFQAPRVIGETRFNHCFAAPTRDPDGYARVRLAGNGRVVTVWMDATFNYVVLFTGDALPPGVARGSLAIEPMTCGSDALNHPSWGLLRLAPSGTHRSRWGVTAE